MKLIECTEDIREDARGNAVLLEDSDFPLDTTKWYAALRLGLASNALFYPALGAPLGIAVALPGIERQRLFGVDDAPPKVHQNVDAINDWYAEEGE